MTSRFASNHPSPIRALVVGALAFAAGACSSSGGGNNSGCPTACPAGTTCNPATKLCVSNQAPQCTPDCTAGHTFCAQATQRCECDTGYIDCNADKDSAGGDGCECNGTCNGAQCAGTTPAGCEPSVLDACGSATRYCNAGTCADCPGGKFNCDGTGDCEQSQDCAAGGCETFGDKKCTSQSQYCDVGTKACVDCAAGTFNCDRSAGTCECGTGCDGGGCKKQCTYELGCGDIGQQCDIGQCVPCPAGKVNCDTKAGCECDSAGCDGTACKGTRFCDYLDTNNPCGAPEMWCYQNECRRCSDLDNDGRVDYLNCNGTKGCECDEAGCSGTQCAGKCSGGECP